MQKNLKSLTDTELLSFTQSAITRERAETAIVVKSFHEIQNRKLYLEYGYSSLFHMATDYFGYCAGSAQLRINSMRLLQAVPEVESKLESGELKLTTAATVQRFFYQEEQTKTAYTKEAKLELIEMLQSKSTREVTQELAKRNPEILKRETTRHVTEDRLSLTLTITNELNQKLTRLKDLLSHSNPDMKNETLLEWLAEIGLEKLDPLRKAKRREVRKVKVESVHAHEAVDNDQELKPASRYVPAKEESKVWLNNHDEGCEFVSLQTGKRCGSKQFLQKDHVKPFSHGGPSTANNLRIYCATHNRFAWQSRTQMRT